jgi:hypothetical protein
MEIPRVSPIVLEPILQLKMPLIPGLPLFVQEMMLLLWATPGFKMLPALGLRYG